jgi:potassium efflux system protein
MPTPVKTVLPELSGSSIEERIREAQEAPDITEEGRARAIGFYNEARESLQAADEWIARASEYERARLEAPDRLESLRKELERPIASATEEVKTEVASLLVGVTEEQAALSQLEQLVIQAEAELSSANDLLSNLDTELKTQSERRNEIQDFVEETKEQLEAVTQDLEVRPAPEEPAIVTRAQRLMLLAQKRALEKALAAYEQETLSYRARTDLIKARMDLASRTATQAVWRRDVLQDLVRDAYQRTGKKSLDQAQQDVLEAERLHPSLRKIAELNMSLVVEGVGRTGVPARTETKQAEAEALGSQREAQKDFFERIQEKVKVGGFTNAVGVLLRKQRHEMLEIRDLKAARKSAQSEISRSQLRLLDLEEMRPDLVVIEDNVDALLAKLEPTMGEARREEIAEFARTLLGKQKAHLDKLIGEYNNYVTQLFDLDFELGQLISDTREQREYINKNVLWIRSTDPLTPSILRDTADAVFWLVGVSRWGTVFVLLWNDFLSHPHILVSAVLAFGVYFLLRRRVCDEIARIADEVRRLSTDSFLHTVRACILTALLATFWPLVLVYFAWRLGEAGPGSEFARAVSNGLKYCAVSLLVMESVRQVFRKSGLAEVHFRWNAEALAFLRRNILLLIYFRLPLLFVLGAVTSQSRVAWADSLGRFSMMAGILVYVVFAQIMRRSLADLFRDLVGETRSYWSQQLHHLWYPMTIGFPTVLIIASALGYAFTVYQLGSRLHFTFVWTGALILVYSMLLRWLFVERRHLARRRAREKREKAAEAAREHLEEADLPLEEPEPTLSSVNVQTQHLIRMVMVVSLAVAVWVIWEDILPALRVGDRVHLWHREVEVTHEIIRPDGSIAFETVKESVPVALSDLALFILIILVTVIACRNLPGLLEILLLGHLPLTASARYAMATISRYLIMVVGIVMAFGAIGVGWSQVQWMVAAMSVGLGFGLQEIFANFVSGLVIFFERPIRLGDYVTLGNVSGRVTRIQIRATTVTDLDRKELIVPNREFITSKLINWTLSDNVIRAVVKVGIAYGSDTLKARDVLLRAAKEHPDVLEEPAPQVFFTQFGDSSLNFELRAFVAGFEDYIRVPDDLHQAIDQGFREAGIQIPFPQRDLHVRSIKDKVQVQGREEIEPPEM